MSSDYIRRIKNLQEELYNCCDTEVEKLREELHNYKEGLEIPLDYNDKLENFREELYKCKNKINEKINELEVKLIYLSFAYENSGSFPLEFWKQKQEEFAKELEYESPSDLWKAYNSGRSIEKEIDQILCKRGLNPNESRDFLRPLEETELKYISYYLELFKKLKV
jgi:hypothetical protein